MSLQPATDDRNKQLLYKIAALIEGGAIGGGVDPDVIFGLRPGGDFTGATFTGNSLATYIAQDGLVRFAPHNYLYPSGDITHVFWNKGLVTVTLAGDVNRIIETSGSGMHAVWVIASAVAGEVCTASFYAKAAGRNIVSFFIGSPITTAFSAYPRFNLSTGVVTFSPAGVNSRMTDAGGGWWKCEVTFPATGTGDAYFYLVLYDVDNSGGWNYVGDGVSGAEFKFVQFEKNISASSFVSTTVAGPILRTPRNAHYVQGNRTLLLEGARTNYCFYSQDLSYGWSPYITGTGVAPIQVANAGVAPDGSNTAASITVNRTTTGMSMIYQTPTIPAGTHTFSCWFKAVAAGDVGKTIDLAVNAAGYFTKLVTLTANWQRVEITKDNVSQVDVGYMDIGTAGTGPVSFYAWGAQLELGPSASSLIYTTTAAVTRVADVLYFPWELPPQEQTLFMRGSLASGNGVYDTMLNIVGVSGGSQPRLVTTNVNGTVAISLYDPTGAAVSSGAGPGVASPYSFEFRGEMTAAGNVRGAVATNGGIESIGALSGTLGMPTAWALPHVLSIAGDVHPSWTGFYTIRDIIIAKGVKDLAYFRTLVNRPPDILHWKMNEGSGTVVGAAVGPAGTTNASWVTGKSGSGFALSFNGTSNILSSVAPVVYGANSITVAFWLYLGSTVAIRMLYESGSNYNAPLVFTAYEQNASGVCMCYSTGDIGAGWRQETNLTPMPIGSWFHFACVHSRGDIRIFINGVESATVIANDLSSGNGNFDPHTLFVGSRSNTALFLDGKIDDFRIYSGDRSSDLAAIMADAQ